MFRFAWKGGDRVSGNIMRVARGMPNRLARAEYEETSIEMVEMKRRTPVWNPARPLPPGHTPGSLRASGTVHEPLMQGNRITTSFSFGNEMVDYAIQVHEDPDAFHATGQYKYAESVWNESRPYMGARIASRARLGELLR